MLRWTDLLQRKKNVRLYIAGPRLKVAAVQPWHPQERSLSWLDAKHLEVVLRQIVRFEA